MATSDLDSYSHILVVGATKVGKTTLLSSLCHGQTDYYQHTVTMDKYIDVTRQLIFFDTAGIEDAILASGFTCTSILLSFGCQRWFICGLSDAAGAHTAVRACVLFGHQPQPSWTTHW
jgi:hypothetical protein